MSTLVEDIKAFHTKFEFNQEALTIDKLHFRTDLLMEEISEMHAAIEQNNPEEFVDALVDIIYIAIGTLDLSQVDIQAAWNQVQTANMSKIRGIKPGREHSGGFDVIKPIGWKAPSHHGNHGLVASLLS